MKRIVIISLIGILLLIGGITLYKTFALYEEKKEFNVLKGVVPDYREKDRRGTLRAALYKDTTAFYQYKSKITKVVLEDTMNPKETELSWDVSEGKDGSVMSYLVPNESDTTTYTLYIQSKGGVKANPNSNYLFSMFTNLTTIEGLKLLDTSKVTTMDSMFYFCSSLTSLDLSHFDTSKVTNMYSMFSYCNSLTSLDLSNFDTSNVTNMGWMFYSCRSLTSLDLDHFDTSNVTDMSGMFQGCRILTNLDLSRFDTSKVTNMYSMFSNCSSLTSLDISHFDTSNVTNTDLMFYEMPSSAIVKVKDEETQTWVLNSNNGHPYSWTEENFIMIT